MTRALRISLTALSAVLLAAAPALAGGGGGGGGSDHGSRRRVTASEAFVELPGLTATVVQDFQARGVLHVEAGLEIPNARMRALAERMMPRLRANCAGALMAYAGDQYRYGAAPDADRISALLQAAANEVLDAEDGEAELLLTSVIVHEGR